MRSELLAELISRTTWRHVAGALILRFHFARIFVSLLKLVEAIKFFFSFSSPAKQMVFVYFLLSNPQLR